MGKRISMITSLQFDWFVSMSLVWTMLNKVLSITLDCFLPIMIQEHNGAVLIDNDQQTAVMNWQYIRKTYTIRWNINKNDFKISIVIRVELYLSKRIDDYYLISSSAQWFINMIKTIKLPFVEMQCNVPTVNYLWRRNWPVNQSIIHSFCHSLDNQKQKTTERKRLFLSKSAKLYHSITF
jgi:hypothetical protein